jgi:uncharacterized protein YjbI with pentapeptide repeats
MCKYQYKNKGGDVEYSCPFDAERGKEYCIFHSPVDGKNIEEFWKHFANYFFVLIEKTTNENIQEFYNPKKINWTNYLKEIAEREELETLRAYWIFKEWSQELYLNYSQKIEKDVTWKFIGFKFPSMDDMHNLSKFMFYLVDFHDVQFNGWANFKGTAFLDDARFRGAQFLTKTYFKDVQFLKEAYFRGAQFSEKVSFRDVQFLGKARFSSAQFSKEAYFSNTQFLEKSYFGNVRFFGEARFLNVHFSEDTYFTGAQFLGEANFRNARFTREANFTGIQFSGGANFKDVHFSEIAFFGSVQFSKEARFSNAQFIKNAYFRCARFLEKSYFGNVRFLGEARFSGAQFSGEVTFKGVQFSKEAYLVSTQFSDKAYFRRAQFSGQAYFEGAQFSGEANFRNARFTKETRFSGAQFLMEANFQSVRFSEIVKFSFAQFLNYTNFGRSWFLKNGLFTNVKFLKEIDFTNSSIQLLDFTQCEISSFMRFREINSIKQGTPPTILLRDLRFWENGHLLLEDFDVSKVSFWQTNFYIIRPRIDFVRVNWGKEKVIIDDIEKRQEYKKYKTNTQDDWLTKEELNLIYDPIEKLPEKSKAETIEQCYRQIRMNYEAGGEHPDAGEFYKHEMRVRGKRLKKDKKFIWCLHKLYGFVSSYGESPEKPLIWLCGFVVIFSIIYMFTGVKDINGVPIQYYFYGDSPNLSVLISNFGKSIVYALSSLIPSIGRLYSFGSSTWWTIFFSFLEGILGVSVITLFVLAVRRRFRRESQ